MKDGATESVVDEIRRRLDGKVDGFEVYVSTSTGLSVEARDGVVDAFKMHSGGGVGLRTLTGGRPGFSYSTFSPADSVARITEDLARHMVASALSGAEEATVDEYLTFASPALKSSSATEKGPGRLVDPSFASTTEEEKIETALAIEKSAVGFDKKVRKVRGASYNESVRAWRVVNSAGVDVSHRATYFTGSVMAVAGDGDGSQMGYELGMGHMRSAVDPEWIGREAARRVVESLGAGKIETRKGPVVFENAVVMELLGALAGSFLASNVVKGKSMLVGREGERVASSLVNIIDDGVMDGGWSSGVFDSEGAVRQRTPLVTGGVCKGFLYDTYWAARQGALSTGNGVRGSFKGSPSVGTTNLYMESGDRSLAGLLEEMGDGLFITEMMGVHTVDTVTGDFSLGASGFLVKGGKVGAPVRGFALSGTLLDLFSSVVSVGSDLRFLGSIGAPSLLVCDVDASGS